jgi:hypothetical protein
MATPARLVELRCPLCHEAHWVVDNDFRAAFLAGGQDLLYEERTYTCDQCGGAASGHEVLRKSPAEFFLQPHPMHPMKKTDYDYWVAILAREFPEHPLLRYMRLER